MILSKKSFQLNSYLSKFRETGKKIGFVPTMGALHLGHLSLINASVADNDYTVCSIFINPTQFNDPGDLRKYPVTLEKDIVMLFEKGADFIFLPSVDEIYPNGMQQLPHFELGNLESVLEGGSRPGHFQGVCQVMSRLLNIVLPDNLYMGQKDYQQCLVVARLLHIMQAETLLVTCDTLREKDGLAMSSRNMRLNAEERIHAPGIYRALNGIRSNLHTGNIEDLKRTAVELLTDSKFRTDYVEIADKRTLEKVTTWDGNQQLVALAAAFMNDVRLIDNMKLTD